MEPAGMQLTVSCVGNRTSFIYDRTCHNKGNQQRELTTVVWVEWKTLFQVRNFSLFPHTGKKGATHFTNKTWTSILQLKTFSMLFCLFAHLFKGLMWKPWTNTPTYLGFRSSLVKDCGFETTARQKRKLRCAEELYPRTAPGDPSHSENSHMLLSVQLHCYKVKFNNFLVFLSHPAHTHTEVSLTQSLSCFQYSHF